MSREIVYTLTVEADGQFESECVAGEKGAGEAKKQLEKQLKGINFAAANTNLKYVSLVQVSP